MNDAGTISGNVRTGEDVYTTVMDNTRAVADANATVMDNTRAIADANATVVDNTRAGSDDNTTFPGNTRAIADTNRTGEGRTGTTSGTPFYPGFTNRGVKNHYSGCLPVPPESFPIPKVRVLTNQCLECLDLRLVREDTNHGWGESEGRVFRKIP